MSELYISGYKKIHKGIILDMIWFGASIVYFFTSGSIASSGAVKNATILYKFLLPVSNVFPIIASMLIVDGIFDVESKTISLKKSMYVFVVRIMLDLTTILTSLIASGDTSHLLEMGTLDRATTMISMVITTINMAIVHYLALHFLLKDYRELVEEYSLDSKIEEKIKSIYKVMIPTAILSFLSLGGYTLIVSIIFTDSDISTFLSKAVGSETISLDVANLPPVLVVIGAGAIMLALIGIAALILRLICIIDIMNLSKRVIVEMEKKNTDA